MRRNSLNCPMWACELCHNRSNPTVVNACLICQAIRPRYRFGIQFEGKYYICKLKTKRFVPSVSISEVSMRGFDTFTVKLDSSDASVETSITEAIVEHARKNMEEQAVVLLEPLVVPETICEMEPVVTSLVTEDASPSTLVPVLAESPRKQSKKQKSKGKLEPASSLPEGGSLLGMFDPGMSLFDTVMHNAKSFAYDGKIGQYISIDTVNRHEDGSAGNHDHMIKKELSYIESMRKEQVVMKQVVQEVVKRRADDTYLYDSHADLDINRNEWEKDIECAMCERIYPKSQMPGQISFKAIADWKALHGAPFPQSDYRLTRGRQLEATKLCCFCTQFFDRNAVDLVDKQAIKEMVGMGQMGLNGPLNCSNTVYKKLFRRAVDSQKNLEDRPLSRIRHRVALDVLRLRAQNKGGSDARFIYNPKSDHIVDQEKVGKYLRNKYGASSTISALLEDTKDRKPNRVKLKPVAAGADSNAALGGGEAELNEKSSTATSSLLANNQKNDAASRLSIERRSLSAGVRRSASRAVKSSSSLVRQKSTGSAASGSGFDDRNKKGKSGLLQKIAHIANNRNSTDKLSGSTEIPGQLNSSIEGPLKDKKKYKVGFASDVDTRESHNHIKTSPKRRKMKKQDGGTAPVRERKPLILKVSASTVVGSEELGKVIEIELQSSVAATGKEVPSGPTDPSADGGKASGNTAAGPVTELSQPLRGLFQHMKLRKREDTVVPPAPMSPTQALSSSDGLQAKQNLAVSQVQPSPDALKPKKKPQNQLEPAQDPSPPAKDKKHPITNKASPQPHAAAPPVGADILHSPKPKKTKASVGHSQVLPIQNHSKASWKHNVNKPVLRDAFDGSSGKFRDHSYITQVPYNDDFIIDENYEDDHSAASEQDTVGSVPSVPSVHSIHTVPSVHSVDNPSRKSRADSYDDPYELDDDFEVDADLPGAPSDVLDADWEGAGSMDQYNWVSAGPYVPSAGDGTIDDDAGNYPGGGNNGFSPVNLEASMYGQPIDRMRMLSRGSAGGLVTPSSRTGARGYSGRHTPKIPPGAGMLGSPTKSGSAAAGTSIEEDRYNNRVRSRDVRLSSGSGRAGQGQGQGLEVTTPGSGSMSGGLHYSAEIKPAKPTKPVIVRKMEQKPKVHTMDGEAPDLIATKPRRRERC